jgi:lipopolysaccharide biosynthesis regulator YciM
VPRDVDAALRRALLRVLDHDLSGAEEDLARAVRIDSDQVDAYLALARLYRMRGEIGRAIRVHQNLLLRRDLGAEDRIQALLGLAGDFRQGGFLQRAIAAYEEVLAHRPNEEAALEPLVGLLADVRDHARAIAMSKRLSRRRGSDERSAEARLLVEMAETARAEGRAEDAKRALRRALRRDPLQAAAWLELGALEAERGRSRRALAAWSRVPDLDRRAGAQVYPRLESGYAALGRPRDFEAYLRRRLAEHPGDGEARLALARTLAARGEADAAVAEVRQVLEREPGHLAAHVAVARMLLGAGRDAEALKELEELLEVLDRRGLRDAPESLQ